MGKTLKSKFFELTKALSVLLLALLLLPCRHIQLLVEFQTLQAIPNHLF